MSVTLLPSGVGVSVEIAVASTSPAWSVSAWNDAQWAQTDTSLGNFVDVTCDCSEVHLSGGATAADGALTRWEARTATITLWGPKFDPWNGPWAGQLTPGMPVRVRWHPPGDPTWRPAFTGTVDDAGYTWDPATNQTTLGAVDDTAILAAWDGLAQAEVGGGETADQRVNRILDAASWPSTARNIAASTTKVIPTTLAGTAWEMLIAVADTDLAMCWVDRAGTLNYQPLARVQTNPGPPDHIIDPSCTPPAGHVQAASLGTDNPVVTRNIVSITRQSYDSTPAATVTLRDDASVARFRPHSYSRTDLVHQDPNWSTTIAQEILQSGAWPALSPTAAGLDVLLGAEAAYLLLGSEPKIWVQVLDRTGRAYSCIVLGSDVLLTPDTLSGQLVLDNLSRLQGDRWNQSLWNQGKWAV